MRINMGPLSVRRIVTFHCVVALILGLLSIGAGFSWFVWGHDHVYGIVERFYADSEAAFINWYSICLIFLNALLVGFVAIEKRRELDRDYRHWWILTAVFLYFSIDESVMIHDLFTKPVHDLLNATGILFQAWVIPYSILSLVIGIYFVGFLLRLPRRFAVLFVLSGLLYIAGAIGMEMLQAPLDERHRGDNMVMCLMVTVEEVTELLAMVLFNYSILTYIRETIGNVELDFASEPDDNSLD